jgi:hypothetical protein
MLTHDAVPSPNRLRDIILQASDDAKKEMLKLTVAKRDDWSY